MDSPILIFEPRSGGVRMGITMRMVIKSCARNIQNSRLIGDWNGAGRVRCAHCDDCDVIFNNDPHEFMTEHIIRVHPDMLDKETLESHIRKEVTCLDE